MVCDSYSSLVPQCEALRTCRLGSPIATLEEMFEQLSKMLAAVDFVPSVVVVKVYACVGVNAFDKFNNIHQ